MNKLKQPGRKHDSDNYQICSMKTKHVVVLSNTFIFLRSTILIMILEILIILEKKRGET